MSTLSLLPVQIRQSLLYGFPAADVCKFEESHDNMFALTDFTSIWTRLLDYFIELLFRRTPDWTTHLGPLLHGRGFPSLVCKGKMFSYYWQY